jgi:5-methylcytosine-specific restriction endonuclease McrA
MRTKPPTPAEQIAFLGNIERLLSEGQFVATYKYALLIAIADLAVQLGSDDGSELELPLRAIAEQFIELYWRHSAPYGTGADSVLIQNSGKQALVLSIVANLQRQHGTLMGAQASPAWTKAITQTARLISTMPLWRLQVLRSQTLDFLYERGTANDRITLKPGVAANLRRFHGMIVRLAQSEWMHFIQALPRNAPLLGATSDLGQFLFGAERAALVAMAPALADAQEGQCLYCGRRVSAGHIDHFIPWSRYPRDLAHNLVLAHVECNAKKSDLLASEAHLEKWLDRNAQHDTAIIKAGRTANIIVDGPATLSVATWAYSHAAQLGAAVWVGGNVVEPLTGRWRSLLYAQNDSISGGRAT